MNITAELDKFESYIFGEGGATLSRCDGGVLVSNRTEKYSSLGVHLETLFGSKTGYNGSMKLKTASGEVTLALYYKVINLFNGEPCVTYSSGGSVTVNSEGFTEAFAKVSFLPEFEVTSTTLYFIQTNTENLCDIIVKDVSVEENEGAKLQQNTILPQKRATVGAIRWDAYYTSDYEDYNEVSRQVTRTLGPVAYHTHAPFFTHVNEDNTVSFNEATQEQFDRECEYAIYAGIDYFAYCWYGKNNHMSYARHQHLTSKYRNDIKMCAIIGVYTLDDDSWAELAEQVSLDFYLKIDNRPVVYVFCGYRFDMNKLDAFTARVEALGKTEKPLYICMGWYGNPLGDADMLSRGFDAVSAYGMGSSIHGEAYADYAARNLARHSSLKDFGAFVNTVPCFSCGLDFRPRIDNPVTWMKGNYFVHTPDGETLKKHACEFFESLVDCHSPINSILMYAWNEHDEGGWICPTLTLDENGKVVRDENGNNVPDTSHLEAIKAAIALYREKEEAKERQI